MYSTFSIATDIASCADDMTPYNTNWTEELVINKLDETSSILFKWCNDNYIILNSDNSRENSD